MVQTDKISINELFSKTRNGKELSEPYTFIVPSYQRGYRWEPVHIKHLFDDLNAFGNCLNLNPSKKYCLQPIIVKPFNEEENKWELVDGQQRLTSLWFMRQLCFAFRGEDDDDTENENFYKLEFPGKQQFEELIKTISEQAKNGMGGYIKSLNEDESGNYLYEKFNVKKNENIDVDCAVECIKTILSIKRIISNLKLIFSNVTNNKKVSDSVLIIWYQLDKADNPVTVFSNINANKIKLTESELIKAQIFSNLTGDYRDQNETSIATQWESIERDLCKNDYWYFLNAGVGKETGTRIDFLFDIWQNMQCENDSKLGYANDSNYNDCSDYPLSDLVENTLNNAEDRNLYANEIWKKIVEINNTLTDWKNDYFLYHTIGLIIAINKINNSNVSAANTIKDLIQEYRSKSSKYEFKLFLKRKIRDVMYSIIENSEKNFSNFVDSLKKLSYENTKDISKLRIILLMYNIASLINAKNEHERFPFDLFFADRYDIEHINPISPNEENQSGFGVLEIKKWYENLGIIEEYNELFDGSSEKDSTEKLIIFANKYSEEHKLNKIGNLVLLDENTNRGYHNDGFSSKRKVIIDILRTGRRNLQDDHREKFIPIGTKWVFLKAFSDIDNDKMSVDFVWNGMEDYEKDIILQLWILQSELLDERYPIIETDSNEGNISGSLVYINKKYYFLQKDENGYISSIKGKICLTEDNTNGLASEGKYFFDGTGVMQECND